MDTNKDNTHEEGTNLGGRPRLFDTPEALQKKADEYFTEKDNKHLPYTVAGLAYHLGFTDRKSLSEYKNYEGFSDTVKRIRLKIEAQKNEMLLSNNRPTAGVKFDLEVNHGWKSATTVNTNLSGEIKQIQRTIIRPPKPESN